MIVSTALNLFFVPVIYVAVGAVRARFHRQTGPGETSVNGVVEPAVGSRVTA